MEYVYEGFYQARNCVRPFAGCDAALYRTDRRPVAAPAPAGFDNLSNGLVSQTMLEADRELFADRETIEDGLGPVYNAVSCADCHQNPVIGGPSQVTELRAG